ncbi:MAG: hypothetical protein K0S40_1175 [Actinomycetospora sp.]|jgi:hypothetical protein|nr:hypothetical protein [Actinomycetospora sp.]
MLDSGVRIAAAFLPVGIPVLVGLVVALLRRRVLPGVAGPAIAGLFLQLLAVLASTFLVAEAGLGLFGVGRDSLLTVSSVIGFAVIVLNVLSWTLLLVALFRRLPARSTDRTPTGRHALLDEQGEQVIAEEGTTLLPVGAAAAGAGAGVGLGAAAAGSAPAEPPPAPHEEPWPDDEPAVTETFAVEPQPASPGVDRSDAGSADLDREEPPAVTAESLDEAAETEDEAHGDVAETPDEPADADEARDEDEAPETTTLSTAEVEDAPVAETVPADDVPADDADDLAADTTPDPDREDDPDDDAVAVTESTPVADTPAEDTSAEDTPADPASDDPSDEEPAVTDTLPAASPDAGTPDRAPTSAGHPWFDPAGESEQGATEPTRAGSTEGR